MPHRLKQRSCIPTIFNQRSCIPTLYPHALKLPSREPECHTHAHPPKPRDHPHRPNRGIIPPTRDHHPTNIAVRMAVFVRGTGWDCGGARHQWEYQRCPGLNRPSALGGGSPTDCVTLASIQVSTSPASPAVPKLRDKSSASQACHLNWGVGISRLPTNRGYPVRSPD